MTFNVKRLVFGGLAAGLVLTVLNVAAQLLLGDRVQHDLNAWVPGIAERMRGGAGALVAGIAMKVVIGILLVGLYATVRPHVASRLHAASYAAIFVWLLGAIYFSDFLLLGMMSGGTYALLEALQLVSFVIATGLGAMIYAAPKEAPPLADRLGSAQE